ncbi:hypothetical protein V3C99_003783, partial [Haemonchus contortus]
KTAPGIFQQVMNKMVTGLQGVATYLDDILVSGRNEQEHRENLFAVFGRISDLKMSRICEESHQGPLGSLVNSSLSVAKDSCRLRRTRLRIILYGRCRCLQ